MKKRPLAPPSRAEIEAALARLRRALDTVESGSPAAGAYRAAIGERERNLAAIEGAGS